MAPTIKNKEDIENEITLAIESNDFLDEIKVLTNTCYAQVNSPSYSGPRNRKYNPYFTLNGSYGTGAYLPTTIRTSSPSWVVKVPAGERRPWVELLIPWNINNLITDGVLIERMLNIW